MTDGGVYIHLNKFTFLAKNGYFLMASRLSRRGITTFTNIKVDAIPIAIHPIISINSNANSMNN